MIGISNGTENEPPSRGNCGRGGRWRSRAGRECVATIGSSFLGAPVLLSLSREVAFGRGAFVKMRTGDRWLRLIYRQSLRASSYQLLDSCEPDQLANAASCMSCLRCSHRHECQDKLTDPETECSPCVFSLSPYSQAVP